MECFESEVFGNYGFEKEGRSGWVDAGCSIPPLAEKSAIRSGG
jgi:hypothetical protein